MIDDVEIPKEGGYSMVVTAILLPVLVLMVALATDAAMYYLRGVEIQRTADAAALGGVTRMPRFADAQSVVLDVARRNGFQNGDGGVTVQASFPRENNKRLTVSVRDSQVPVFFGSFIKKNWDITKTATAEYISNIPLGSVQNAIGTGYLADADMVASPATYKAQNFWLGVSGPCAAKEAGDQQSSRYDGNAVNPSVSPGNTSMSSQGSQLCDWDPAQTSMDAAARAAYIASRRDAKNTEFPGLHPALVANKDYDELGYNYIVDVPCVPTGTMTEAPPPPCDGAGQELPTGKDLVIQIYDPVFNPDSVQRFVRAQPGAGSKPDQFGLNFRPGALPGCTAAGGTQATVCAGVYGGTGLTANPSAESIRLRTDVRVYPPDATPLDYEGDVALPLSGNGVVAVADSTYVTGGEAGRVRRFGSCVRWTDAWTNVKTVSPGVYETESALDVDNNRIPDTAVAPFVNDTTTFVNPTGAADPAGDDCANTMDQWVTVARVPYTDTTMKRGRFRLNIRTIDSVNSFGTNAFAVRAMFVPSAQTPPVFTACEAKDLTIAQIIADPCASVAGDSTMSVFTSVPGVSRFYLARLSPPSLYRNKQVIVQLFDPGEGGNEISVLRPRAGMYSGGTPETCTVDNDGEPPGQERYCIQTFDWSIWNPGIVDFTQPAPLDPSERAYVDNCLGKGQTGQTVVVVQGDENSIAGCPSAFPPQLKASRNGFQSRDGVPAGRMNDRTVALNVQIPKDYGCAPGTGITTLCVELPATQIAQGGWWKIKYAPRPNPAGGYFPLTDRTTWAVQLLGDPVHLVTGG